MFKVTKLCSALMLGFAALCVSNAQAAKAVHQDGLVEEEFYVYASSLQDLTTDVVIHKTLFRGFDAIYTTVTLNVIQDSKGNLAGTATVGSTEMVTTSIPVTGKMSSKKGPVTLSLTGKVEGEKKTKLTIKSTLFRCDIPPFQRYVEDPISFQDNGMMMGSVQPRTNVTEIIGPDSLLAKSHYRSAVSFTSPVAKYNFVSDHIVFGFPLIDVKPALPEDVVGLKPAKYFEVLVPFGVTLGTGTATSSNGETLFSVNAKGISAFFAGQTYGNGFFVPNFISAKIGPSTVVGNIVGLIF